MAPRIITAVARDDGVEADDGAPAPWWSFTKTVLAAAALALVSQGRLRLDAALPGRAFTLRHLLQHRSGLPDYGGLAAYHEAVAAGTAPWPEEEMLRRVGCPVFEPGERFSYSNAGYLLVRRLVEDAAGAAFGDALRQLVLDPLGIAGARAAARPADLDGTAWGNDRRYDPGWVYHGLLVGSAGDAALLLHGLLGGGLLPRSLLEAMCDGQPVGGPVPDRPWQSAAYGLGLMCGIGDPALRYVGHTGGGRGSTVAVYGLAEHAGCTAAVFADAEAPGVAERHAMALAHEGWVKGQ